MFESNREAALAGHRARARCVSTAPGINRRAVRWPQRLGGVMNELKGALHQINLWSRLSPARVMETIAGELLHPAVVRAMPNTPAQIGQGMTAWTATREVTEPQLHRFARYSPALAKRWSLKKSA
ncbi:MAG: hypothetical protein WKF84_03700 [Pyrinomonadaceae bacterium]